MMLMLLMMMSMKCYGIESEKSLVVGKLSSEDIPRSFSFSSAQINFIQARRGGAGRSGAESGAYRRHVSKSLDNKNLFCRIGVSTTFFFLPTLHYITNSRSTHCILSMTSHT